MLPVAPVFNLLYRRFPIGRVPSGKGRPAGWKPAIQQIGNLRYAFRPHSPMNCPGYLLSSATKPATMGRWSEPKPQLESRSAYVSSASHSFASPRLSRM